MIGQMQMSIEGKIADKVETAIRRLQAFEPEEGYFVAFSGGKDSQCIYHLCKAAGVKFDAHYNVTSVDPVAANYKVLETKKDTIIMNDDNDPARQMVENCYRTQKTMLNPIVDWDDEDVWEYLNDIVRVPHCKLYDDGLKRLGCIGCPMQSPKRQRAELERYPKYKALYLTAFGKMLENISNKNLETTTWHTPEEVMEWWIGQ